MPSYEKRDEFIDEARRIMAEEGKFGFADAVCVEMDLKYPKDFSPFLCCHANVLFMAKRYEEALPFYDRTIELKSDFDSI